MTSSVGLDPSGRPCTRTGSPRAMVAELKRLGKYGPGDPAAGRSSLRSDGWPYEVEVDLVAAVDALDTPTTP